ncbi:MAG: prephenate dehydrogenase/arogenate dehydrogenase family protein [Solirubrobacterales bacterium]
MRVAVLGVGLIGGSIGLAARSRLGAEVIGHDPDPGTVEAALARGAIDRGTAGPGEAVEGAEVVFCAAPVGELASLVAEALRAAGPDTAVSDVGSTKRALVEALGEDERFIGGHPLAGAETAGVQNAREELFEGARWFLTPAPGTSGVLYDRLQRTVGGLGARPQALDAAAHDRLMATVSHLPHVIANVVASQARSELLDDSSRLPEVGPSLRDATRVAGSNPAVWADIFSSNREALADAVEGAAGRLREASELLRDGDREALASWQAAAAEDRRSLLEAEATAGPSHELRVVVRNRPGTVAALALALGDAGVNIEDMALYPAQDMTTGAVTIGVAGAGAAERAAEVIRGLGHTVTVASAGE